MLGIYWAGVTKKDNGFLCKWEAVIFLLCKICA